MLSALMNRLPFSLRRQMLQRVTLLRIASNAGWLYANSILRLGISLVIGLWVARYLGPEQYGLLNYAVALTALFGVVVPLGLGNLVVRELAVQPEKRHIILGTAFAMQLGASVVASVLAIIIGGWVLNDDSLTRKLILVFSLGILLKPVMTLDYWFQSQVRSKYTALANSASLLMIFVVRALLVLYEAPLLAFAGIIVLENLVNALALSFLYRRTGESMRAWRVDVGLSRSLIKESLPFLLSSISVLVYMRIDQVMLRELSGDTATGLYSASVRISEIWYFIPTAIITSVSPLLAKARQESQARYYQILDKLFSTSAFISLAIATLISLLATPIITFLYGASFADAAPILALHVWSGVPVAMGMAMSPWIVNEGFGKISLQRSVAGALLNVLLNFWLIPPYQGIGAAIATVLAYVSTTFVWQLLDPRMRHVGLMQIRAFWPGSWLKILRSSHTDPN